MSRSSQDHIAASAKVSAASASEAQAALDQGASPQVQPYAPSARIRIRVKAMIRVRVKARIRFRVRVKDRVSVRVTVSA